MPIEVIIGDNGGDEDTASVVADFEAQLPIKHIVHNPPMNYGGNLKAILSLAKGDWVSVLHDDDFYLSECGVRFRRALQECDFDFFFSDHLFCSNDGVVLDVESKEISKTYNRSLLKRGQVQDPLEAILLSQVCMDGWFVKRDLISKVQVDSRWPEYLDMQYLVQFALNSQKWFYENEHTFVYRLSAIGLTVSGLKVDELFDYFLNLHLEKTRHIDLRDRMLIKFAPVAVTCWLRDGQQDKAMECLRGKYYPFPGTIRGAAKYMAQMAWAYMPGLMKSDRHPSQDE